MHALDLLLDSTLKDVVPVKFIKGMKQLPSWSGRSWSCFKSESWVIVGDVSVGRATHESRFHWVMHSLCSNWSSSMNLTVYGTKELQIIRNWCRSSQIKITFVPSWYFQFTYRSSNQKLLIFSHHSSYNFRFQLHTS